MQHEAIYTSPTTTIAPIAENLKSQSISHKQSNTVSKLVISPTKNSYRTSRHHPLQAALLIPRGKIKIDLVLNWREKGKTNIVLTIQREDAYLCESLMHYPFRCI